MNEYPFYHEPSSQPIEFDVEERMYLFEERIAIHVFDGHATQAMAVALASGNQTSIEFLNSCGHGEPVQRVR